MSMFDFGILDFPRPCDCEQNGCSHCDVNLTMFTFIKEAWETNWDNLSEEDKHLNIVNFWKSLTEKNKTFIMDNFKNLASDELIRNSLSEENKEFLIDNFNCTKDDDDKFVFYQNRDDKIPIRSIPRFKRYIAKEELYYNETSLDFEVTEGNITEFQRRQIEQLKNGYNFFSFKKINKGLYLKKKLHQEMRTEYEKTYQIYGCVSYKKQIENENDFVTYWTHDHETFWEVFEEPCSISANFLTYCTVDKIAGDSEFLKKYKEYVEQIIEQKQNEEKRARERKEKEKKEALEDEKRRAKENERKRLNRVIEERERRLKEEARRKEKAQREEEAKRKALEKARRKQEKALERARRKKEKEELERARKEEQALEEAQRKEEAKRKKEEKARRKKEKKARRKKEEKAREEAEKKELDKFFDEIAKENNNNNNNNNNNSTNDSVQKKNNKPKKKQTVVENQVLPSTTSATQLDPDTQILMSQIVRPMWNLKYGTVNDFQNINNKILLNAAVKTEGNQITGQEIYQYPAPAVLRLPARPQCPPGEWTIINGFETSPNNETIVKVENMFQNYIKEMPQIVKDNIIKDKMFMFDNRQKRENTRIIFASYIEPGGCRPENTRLEELREITRLEELYHELYGKYPVVRKVYEDEDWIQEYIERAKTKIDPFFQPTTTDDNDMINDSFFVENKWIMSLNDNPEDIFDVSYVSSSYCYSLLKINDDDDDDAIKYFEMLL